TGTTEIFDPATYHFTYSGSLHIPRCGQTATLLAGGKELLITGGNNDRPRLASAELYNVATSQWTQLPDMRAGREGHQAVLLNNGKVLIIGGSGDPTKATELYNPATRKFESGPTPPLDLANTLAVPLADGRILLAGGRDGRKLTPTAMVYDAATNRFTRVGDLVTARYKCAAANLPDGRSLIIGGSDERDWKGKLRSTELFDPKTNTFSKGPELNFERFKLTHAVITMKSGDLLVAGGDQHLEQWRPSTGRFTVVGAFDQPCYYSTATLLPSGQVLMAGGYGNDAQCVAKAWVYVP
ncbi:Kelch repeat-containing protein, partial [Puia sp.]|uniref:Kelch repeat-containing protein n=1 Tax=Puia sp. TaxID=2045100 RepID=UPI002F41705C